MYSCRIIKPLTFVKNSAKHIFVINRLCLFLLRFQFIVFVFHKPSPLFVIIFCYICKYLFLTADF